MAQHVKTDGKAGARAGNRAPAAPTVIYPDGSGLRRPLDLPRAQWIALVAIVIIAVVFAGIGTVRTLDDVVNREAKQAAEVESVLKAGTAQDVVKLSSYAGLDSAAMRQGMTDAGMTVIDATAVVQNDSNAIDLIKIPANMSAAEAAAAYVTGVDGLSASDATKFLMGSWRLTQQSAGSVDMRVRYADLGATTAEEAIQNAIATQGFDAATVYDSGIDSKNNTYKAGRAQIGGTPYTWTISVCPLNEVYSVSGIPSTAQYVGVRLTAA